jgi:transcriptional regulator of acetoin/glycerol metabolism
VITLPALRERPEDVAVLGRRFLDELPGRALLYFSAATLEALRASRWPGNVRELHNVVHRAAIMARGPTIELDDLPCEVRALAKDSGAIPVSQGDTSERARILALLRDCQGNVDEAARRIGVSRMTLHRKIGKWSISRLVKGRKQPGPNNLIKYAFHQTRCPPAAPSAYRCEPLH